MKTMNVAAAVALSVGLLASTAGTALAWGFETYAPLKITRIYVQEGNILHFTASGVICNSNPWAIIHPAVSEADKGRMMDLLVAANLSGKNVKLYGNFGGTDCYIGAIEIIP